MVTKKEAEAYQIQAEAYQIVGNIFGKLLLCTVVAGVFIATTYVFLTQPSWYTATPDSFVAVVVLQVVRHYFPIPEGSKIIKSKQPELEPPDSEE